MAKHASLELHICLATMKVAVNLSQVIFKVLIMNNMVNEMKSCKMMLIIGDIVCSDCNVGFLFRSPPRIRSAYWCCRRHAVIKLVFRFAK